MTNGEKLWRMPQLRDEVSLPMLVFMIKTVLRITRIGKFHGNTSINGRPHPSSRRPA